MYNDTLEQLIKNTKNFSAPLSDWGKTVAEIYQRTLQQNLEIMSENFGRASDHLKRLSHAKKPEELLALQKECINDNMTAAIGNMQKIMQTTTKNIEELSALCSNTQSQVQTAVKNNNKEVIK